MRFLISRLSSLGDVVCTLPAAAALKKGFPQSHVTWIVDKRFAEVVRCCSSVDEVVEAKKGFSRAVWPELANPYDTAFDLQGLLKSAWPIGISKARQKLGYHWQREGASLFSSKVLPDTTSFHVVDQYVDVVRAAGGVMDRAEFCLSPGEKNLRAVEAKLEAEDLKEFVVLNPGAGWQSKRWSEEHCARVADSLHDRGVGVVLIGGNSEEDLQIGERILALSASKPASWIGQTTIGELIALISLATAYVGGDTGSTHIAAALGVFCVGLYSVTNPLRSCPYGQIERCIYKASLRDISPEDVLSKLEGNLR